MQVVDADGDAIVDIFGTKANVVEGRQRRRAGGDGIGGGQGAEGGNGTGGLQLQDVGKTNIPEAIFMPKTSYFSNQQVANIYLESVYTCVNNIDISIEVNDLCGLPHRARGGAVL
ncbi:hypothetical protein [Massilia sp. DWR3-1-1]|uniref:hypothetical protein n=1 Tax=Massilia sp. DWR3-1-1 TaxID=2804559 RepID=UPI003CEBFA06